MGEDENGVRADHGRARPRARDPRCRRPRRRARQGRHPQARRHHAVGRPGARPAQAGRAQVSRHLRPRLDRPRRGAAHLRGGGRHPHLQLPQRGGDGARRHRAALAVRRDPRGRHLDRPGRAAGLRRLAGGGLERRRRLSHLRRRDDLRRRLQHAAGAEGGAGPVRPDDGHHGPLLRAAHARRRCATRCAAARSPSTIPTAPGRSICCCRSTRSPRASPSTSPRCPSARGWRRSRPPPMRPSTKPPS